MFITSGNWRGKHNSLSVMMKLSIRSAQRRGRGKEGQQEVLEGGGQPGRRILMTRRMRFPRARKTEEKLLWMLILPPLVWTFFYQSDIGLCPSE